MPPVKFLLIISRASSSFLLTLHNTEFPRLDRGTQRSCQTHGSRGNSVFYKVCYKKHSFSITPGKNVILNVVKDLRTSHSANVRRSLATLGMTFPRVIGKLPTIHLTHWKCGECLRLSILNITYLKAGGQALGL